MSTRSIQGRRAARRQFLAKESGLSLVRVFRPTDVPRSQRVGRNPSWGRFRVRVIVEYAQDVSTPDASGRADRRRTFCKLEKAAQGEAAKKLSGERGAAEGRTPDGNAEQVIASTGNTPQFQTNATGNGLKLVAGDGDVLAVDGLEVLAQLVGCRALNAATPPKRTPSGICTCSGARRQAFAANT